MQQSSTVGRTFLDPTILARIGNLELIAKFVVEGFIFRATQKPRITGLVLNFHNIDNICQGTTPNI